MNDETTIEHKTEILADLWLNYRHDSDFSDFVEYNDLGLPLAYSIANKIILPSEKAINLIDESFALLLAGLGIEDTGFESMEDILESGVDE
jgi:hypothetical protein